jgi:hypothetical protein
MGLAEGILNIVGGVMERSTRSEFGQLTRILFADAPIETVQTLFGFFGRGKSYEEEAIAHDVFEAAKHGRPGSLADRNARAMAIRYAENFAKNGPIELVVPYLDMLERVYKQKIFVNSSNASTLLEDVLAKIEHSNDGRYVYVRNRLNKQD